MTARESCPGIWGKLRRLCLNFILFLLSLFFALILGETTLRLALNPGDFLAPTLVPDAILKYRIEPYSVGHDAWGFRNPEVPDSASIVIIGDSQSYGVNAPASQSWPTQLGHFTGHSIYNLSLSGYGPVQYFYLLKEKASQLRPAVVIIGFYLGNDLWDAYQMAHGYAHWRYLVKPEFGNAEILRAGPENEALGNQAVLLGPLRVWMARHSVFYRLFSYTCAERLRNLQMKLLQSRTPEITIMDDPAHHIHTGFTPGESLSVLDLQDSTVREGLAISLDLLGRMNDFCAQQRIAMVVVLIPTKESVYARYVEGNQALSHAGLMTEVIRAERDVNQKIKAFLAAHDIRCCDPLEALQQTAQLHIYPSNQEGHPTRMGYEVIARTVADYLHEWRLIF